MGGGVGQVVRKPLRYLPVSRTTLNHVEPRWRHEDIAGGLQGLGRVSPSPYGLNLDLCCILNDLKGKKRAGGTAVRTQRYCHLLHGSY